MWDTSDSDIEAKFAELKEKEAILQAQISQIRIYQRNINNLKMVPSSEMQDVVVNDVTVREVVTTFSLPANFAGNEISSDYRDSQKADLIVNIDKFLGANELLGVEDEK